MTKFNFNITMHMQTSGWSPLFFGAKAGNVIIVKQLIAGGAAVDMKDKV